ncbi:MAG: hypothetical protein JO015_01105 [Verrucomicrobia bacterium]|nr:hypothetical protein [Verrucomicrobiota bacterium]
MKTIEVFISGSDDVREEQAVVERVIRSVAAEFDCAVSAAHSSRLQRLESADLNATAALRSSAQGIPLRLCFWEYQDPGGEESREQVPNPGQFDLVVCLLWSRLGPPLAPKFVGPDGAVPGSATGYEVAWALDQARIAPGLPALQIYRRRSVPDVPLEPREAREAAFRRWDAVQDFFVTWQERAGEAFTQNCHDYRWLEEFEALFRAEFRRFLASRAGRENTHRPSAQPAVTPANPYRGLYPFDDRHTASFHGRMRSTREALDALRKQAAAGRPFLLVLGPSGAGKSSLVRAGVVPLLVRVGVPGCPGPWRRAVTRPGAVGSDGDPSEALAAALLAPAALPGLVLPAGMPGLDPSGFGSAVDQLASELHQNPAALARRVEKALDEISLDRLDRRLDQQERDFAQAGRRETAEIAAQPRLAQLGAKSHLVLVVDQFEQLFTTGFSREVQHRYITALVALARTRRVFVIATLSSNFYGACQQFPELIEITSPNGRFDLQPPAADEIEQIVRWRAETHGLRFERHARTGQGLDDFLIQAALASAEELPQLEHLLSRLYVRQAARGDGLLRWSDYAELGGFEGALNQHAEAVFNSLPPADQAAADFALQQLTAPAGGHEAGALWTKTVPARVLVSTRAPGDQRPISAKGFVDAFLKEGLLRTSKDPRGETVVTVSHEVLLRKWARPRSFALANREARPATSSPPSISPSLAARPPQPKPPPENNHRGSAGVPKSVTDQPKRAEAAAAVTGAKRAARLLPRLWPIGSRPDSPKPKEPTKPSPTKRDRWVRLLVRLIPVLVLVDGFVAALAVHHWFKRAAADEARQKRVDQAIVAAPQIPRYAETPVPSGTAERQEPAGANGGQEAAGINPEPTAQNTAKREPEPGPPKGRTRPNPRDGLDESAVKPPTSDATAPTSIPKPVSPPEASGSSSPGSSPTRSVPSGKTPAEPSAPLIPELTSKRPNGALSPAPDRPSQPAAAPDEEQSPRAASPSPQSGDATRPMTKAIIAAVKNAQNARGVESPRDASGVAVSAPGSTPAARPDKTGSPALLYSAAGVGSGVPAVEPAPVAPPAATPPQTAEHATVAADQSRLRTLTRDYLQSVENNDLARMDQLFADQVNFYGQGSLGRAQLQDSNQRYQQQWPVRKWTPEGSPKIFGPTGSNMYQILQPFHWMISNGYETRKGDATLQLLVEKDAGGSNDFHIVAVRQLSR